MAQARDEWRASQGELNPERLVFIDETGAATDMARRYGRCPRGQRLVSSVPWGHWKTTTFVAALRVGEIAAPCVFDGPMDGPSFRAYVEQFVVPILREDDIVVMDNLPSCLFPAGGYRARRPSRTHPDLSLHRKSHFRPWRTLLGHVDHERQPELQRRLYRWPVSAGSLYHEYPALRDVRPNELSVKPASIALLACAAGVASAAGGC